MYINSADEKSDIRLYICDEAIDVVKHFEYLGMTIENRLQMNKHAENVYKKARQKLGILYKICKFIKSETALLLYKVIMRPHLEYGDFLIDSANQKCIDKIERLQERILRVIEYEPESKKRKLMKNLKLSMGNEDMCVKRKRSLLNEMFFQSKKAANIHIKDMNKVNLKIDFTRLTKKQRSPYYRGPKLWNSLPESIQNEQNRIKLKASVKLLFR